MPDVCNFIDYLQQNIQIGADRIAGCMFLRRKFMQKHTVWLGSRCRMYVFASIIYGKAYKAVLIVLPDVCFCFNKIWKGIHTLYNQSKILFFASQ